MMNIKTYTLTYNELTVNNCLEAISIFDKNYSEWKENLSMIIYGVDMSREYGEALVIYIKALIVNGYRGGHLIQTSKN